MMLSEIFTVRQDIRQNWAGEVIGIIVLDANYPFVPGNVANACSYKFPVRYKTIRNSSINKLLYLDNEELSEMFLEAAQELESTGVRAITGACGFMVRYQKYIAENVNIPVFLSSLLQLNFIDSVVNKPIAVVTADSSSLSKDDFLSINQNPRFAPVICGMQDCAAFRSAILEESGSLNHSQIRDELVSKVLNLISDHPEIGAILFECSDLPPYAKDVQDSVDLPIFDYTTMINFVASAYLRTSF